MKLALGSLFLFLNIVDFCLTYITLTSGMCVQEANPIINTLIENYGWNFVFAYKILMSLIILIGLHFIFSRKAWFRIMVGVCFGFSIFLIYMFGLLIYLNLEI